MIFKYISDDVELNTANAMCFILRLDISYNNMNSLIILEMKLSIKIVLDIIQSPGLSNWEFGLESRSQLQFKNVICSVYWQQFPVSYF